MNDDVAPKVVDDNGLHDLHQKLSLSRIGFWLLRALTDPEFEIDINDFLGKATEHGLHDRIDLAPD